MLKKLLTSSLSSLSTFDPSLRLCVRFKLLLLDFGDWLGADGLLLIMALISSRNEGFFLILEPLDFSARKEKYKTFTSSCHLLLFLSIQIINKLMKRRVHHMSEERIPKVLLYKKLATSKRADSSSLQEHLQKGHESDGHGYWEVWRHCQQLLTPRAG